MIKDFIRWAYWKFAHTGDAWQSRLVVYHLGRIRAAVPESTAGTTLIAELNAKNGRLERVAEVIMPGREEQVARGLLKSVDGYLTDHDENCDLHKAVKNFLYEE